MNASHQNLLSFTSSQERRSAISELPDILSNIYQDDINIAIWQNSLSVIALQQAEALLVEKSNLNLVIATTTQSIQEQLSEILILNEKKALCEHIKLVVDMFSTLFELKRIGLRLTITDKAMCPKFHVDRIPCRLICTYSGQATQWLTSHHVDYSKLGIGSVGLSDAESGVYQSSAHIQMMRAGDVALLKGSGWYNNEQTGLVHRSPPQSINEKRLIMTLDFID